MPVPYTFGTATAAIPLSQLDSNFATAVTIGNTAVQLGNTVTTLNNLTLANVTISSGNVTITNVAVTTANVSGTANVSSLVVLTNETVLGNTAVTGNVTASINVTGAKLIPTGTSVTGNGLYLPAANALGLSTNGTNAVYIDSSQNVGIGTSTINTRLQVLSSGTDNSAGDSITSAIATFTGPNYAIGTASNPVNLQVMSNSTLGADVGASIGLGGRYSTTQFAQFAVIKGAKENATSGQYGTYLAFGTRANGTDISERMRIDSSGNVGIGTTTLTSGVRLYASNATSGAPATSGTTQSTGALRIRSGSNAICDFGVGANAGTTTWIQAADQTGLNTSYDISMQPNGGSLIVGAVAPVSVGAGTHILSLKGTGAATVWGVGPTSSFGSFYVKSATSTGVVLSTSATAWASDSDERKKTTITPFENAINKICSLRAGTGRYLTDEESMSRSFLIAQDVQSVLPEAVDIGEDVDQSLMLRYTDVIPLLVAAIQEQQALILSLTARITTLETP